MSYLTLLVVLALVGILIGSLIWTIKLVNTVPVVDVSDTKTVWKPPYLIL